MGGGEPSIANSPTTASKAIPMFGVSDELDLQAVIDMAKYGDGVIVGSAIVKMIAAQGRESVKAVGEYVAEMKAAANRG